MSVSVSTLARVWIKLFIFLAYQHSTVAHSYYTKTVLQFGQDDHSYILLKPDMSPVSEAVSVCAWVKRGSNHLSNYQYWLSYVDQFNKTELVISDTGRFFLFKGFGSRHETDLSVGEWHHLCLTWWYPSLTKIAYYDGLEIGSENTRPGRKFRSSGTLMLGQLHKKYGGGGIKDYHFFGGELLDFNIFSKQLTSGQIHEMYTGGRCSNYTQSFGADRYIAWDDILQLERHGTMNENSVVCQHDHPLPTEVTVAPTEAAESLVISTEEVESSSDESGPQYTDLLEDLELPTTIAVDKATTEVPITTTENSQIAEVFANLVGQEDLVGPNANKWEFLYGNYFYGQAITESFLASMISRLDHIVEYFGRTIDETLISEDFIKCMGQRLDILIEFVGHTLDDNLIGHLENHHASGSSGCSGYLWLHLAGVEF